MKTLPMARLVRVAAGLAACCAILAGNAAHAQAWPAKPIRWIVPFPAGGPADTVARQIAPQLGERLGQSVVIDNRPGGNSNIGFEAGARAAIEIFTEVVIAPQYDAQALEVLRSNKNLRVLRSEMPSIVLKAVMIYSFICCSGVSISSSNGTRFFSMLFM